MDIWYCYLRAEWSYLREGECHVTSLGVIRTPESCAERIGHGMPTASRVGQNSGDFEHVFKDSIAPVEKEVVFQPNNQALLHKTLLRHIYRRIHSLFLGLCYF